MLKFFYGKGACSRASHITLEEVGAKFEAVRMNLKDGEQRKPGYLALNPKGRVPTLVTDRGVLTETPAVLVYIAQTHPQANLLPRDDPFAFGQIQSFNSYLCSTVHVAHAHKQRGARWTDDPAALAALTANVPKTVAACFELIENEMFQGPWVMGDAFTICDPYLFTIAQWLESDSIDPTRFPKVYEHRNRMSARPAVQRAIAREEAA
jgi:glutathione S-transferase